MKRHLWLCLVLLLLTPPLAPALVASLARAEAVFVVGTGPVAGSFFPVGGALCNVLNRRGDALGYHCLVEPTGGSEDNLARLVEGSIDFAILQSDWQYLASQGSDTMPAMAELRAVVALQALPFNLVVAESSGIDSIAGLAGHAVNLGPEGSSQRTANEALVTGLGVALGDLGTVATLGVDEQALALCLGRIDAFVFPYSHPNASVYTALDFCGAQLLPLQGPAIDALLAQTPFYAPVTLPAGLYQSLRHDVQTFGMTVTLVTRDTMPDEIVYLLVKGIIEDLDAFRAEHPVLAYLEAKDMATAGLSAPLHSAAQAYFHEAGLLP